MPDLFSARNEVIRAPSTEQVLRNIKNRKPGDRIIIEGTGNKVCYIVFAEDGSNHLLSVPFLPPADKIPDNPTWKQITELYTFDQWCGRE